jgi:hypothetical protein
MNREKKSMWIGWQISPISPSPPHSFRSSAPRCSVLRRRRRRNEHTTASLPRRALVGTGNPRHAQLVSVALLICSSNWSRIWSQSRSPLGAGERSWCSGELWGFPLLACSIRRRHRRRLPPHATSSRRPRAGGLSLSPPSSLLLFRLASHLRLASSSMTWSAWRCSWIVRDANLPRCRRGLSWYLLCFGFYFLARNF